MTKKYEIPPDLREWCEATAPKLNCEKWRDVDRGAEHGHVAFTRDECRALLAYVAEIAAGLSANQRWWMRQLCSRPARGMPMHDLAGYGSGAFASVRVLGRKKLARPFGVGDPKTADEWVAEPLGREVARVLGGDR